MRLELTQFRDHGWGCETSHEDLAGVDVNGSVLAGVVDLEDAIPEIGAIRRHGRFSGGLRFDMSGRKRRHGTRKGARMPYAVGCPLEGRVR
jgi:hypothetical protein